MRACGVVSDLSLAGRGEGAGSERVNSACLLGIIEPAFALQAHGF